MWPISTLWAKCHICARVLLGLMLQPREFIFRIIPVDNLYLLLYVAYNILECTTCCVSARTEKETIGGCTRGRGIAHEAHRLGCDASRAQAKEPYSKQRLRRARDRL